MILPLNFCSILILNYDFRKNRSLANFKYFYAARFWGLLVDIQIKKKKYNPTYYSQDFLYKASQFLRYL